MIDPTEILALKNMIVKTLHKIPTAIYELSQDVFDLQKFYDSPGSECDTGEFLTENNESTSVPIVDEDTQR